MKSSSGARRSSGGEHEAVHLTEEDREFTRKIRALDARKLRSFIRRITGDVEASDDLVQEVYKRLVDRKDSHPGSTDQFEFYAFGIARKVAQDWKRKRRKSPCIDDGERPEDQESRDEEFNPEVTCDRDELVAFVKRKIRRFPEKRREVATRSLMYGYSAREIADQLQLKESTVRKHHSIAVGELYDALTRKLTTRESEILVPAGRRKDNLMVKKRIVQQAARDWLTKLEGVESLQASWPDFQNWLKSSAEREVYRSIAEAWLVLDGLKQLRPPEGPVDENLLRKDARKDASSKKRRRR